MEYLGVSIDLKHMPKLDPGFVPFGVWREAYLKGAAVPIAIAVERNDGKITVWRTRIHGTEAFARADFRYVERMVKFLLWSVGGFRIYLCGCHEIAERLREDYTPTGNRAFDADFFRKVYERDLEILDRPLEDCPQPNEAPRPLGGHLDGCRIGFDAGGSDRKVSAVMDGECVYTEEVVWFPKLQEDPQYQYRHIVKALRTAASKLPRVDAIGVSSAGVFVGNAPMVSSIFYKVPRSRWEEVKTCFDRAAKEIGDVPIVVANDGDVSALAGAMGLGTGRIMGIAMGTSEAVGYVDKDQNVLDWVSELAFAPVDLSEEAAADEWSTDIGAGCKYFSQDAVLKLAPRAGIRLDESLSPAEQLKVVQALAEESDPRALEVFQDIGVYLAHTAVLYAQFYDIERIILMGRVMSARGGEIILETACRVLKEDHPDLAQKLTLMLPDEKTRRIGQAVAAASLPEIN